MATISIAVTGICAGGGHVSATVQLNAGQARPVMWDADDLRGSPTQEEMRDAVRTILRAHLMGMTRAQARAALEAGITVGVGATP